MYCGNCGTEIEDNNDYEIEDMKEELEGKYEQKIDDLRSENDKYLRTIGYLCSLMKRNPRDTLDEVFDKSLNDTLKYDNLDEDDIHQINIGEYYGKISFKRRVCKRRDKTESSRAYAY